jgi:hypothetical protein
MKSESSESETELSSSSKKNCDGATSAAAAVSSQLPIDGEEIIIKTEEIPSSSTKNSTRVKVKKKEEEVAVDDNNNHNDGTSTSNTNYNLNHSVKKEEENENDAPNDGDYDYSDWKAGDWCWLLPATTNNENRQKQPEDDGAIAVTTETDVTSTTTTTGSSSSGTKRWSTRQLRYINDVIKDENATTEPDETPVDPPPKKKMRRKEDSIDKDGDTKIAAVYHETDNDDNIDIIKEETEEGSEQHKVKSTVDNNDNDNDNTNADASINNNNDDDGYESWTEGNWCILLCSPVDDNNDKTKNNSSSKLSANAEATNTCKRRLKSRHRSCDLSPTYLEVDDAVESDTMVGDDDDNDEPTKRTKSTTTYRKWQNKIWNEMFQRLVAYKKKHKSTSVPTKYTEDPKLGNWVNAQRAHHKNKMIPVVRIRRLDSIGFVWNPFDARWMEMYHRLVAYKKQHRSTIVPEYYKEDPKFGIWVSNQRKYYKNKTLSVERINRLESIGFVSDPSDKKWMEMYNRLVAFKKQHKSTKVPRRYMEDPQLGSWVYWQRHRYMENKLTEKRMELLNSIDFAWSAI